MSTQLAVRTTQRDNLALVLRAIESDARLQDSTKRQYRDAVINYVETGASLIDARALNAYAQTVGNSTRAFLSAVITKLTKAMELEAKSQATPYNVADVQATVYRAEALRESVTVEKSEGYKAHTWLSQNQVKRLLDVCRMRKSGETEFGIVAQRDRLALGLLAAAGLRRLEAVSLTFDDVKLQPIQGKMRTVLNVKGKGAKDRVVPISDRLANAIDTWAGVVGNEGRMLRSLGRNRMPGERLSTTALYNLVQKRGAMMGKAGLQPHDLRRTYAQLGYEAGIPVTQISTLLGHASIATTQKYLNLDLDLDTTVSDFIPF